MADREEGGEVRGGLVRPRAELVRGGRVPVLRAHGGGAGPPRSRRRDAAFVVGAGGRMGGVPAGPADGGPAPVGADGRRPGDECGERVRAAGSVAVTREVDLHARPWGAERRSRGLVRAGVRASSPLIVRMVPPLASGEEVGAARGLSRGSGRCEELPRPLVPDEAELLAPRLQVRVPPLELGVEPVERGPVSRYAVGSVEREGLLRWLLLGRREEEGLFQRPEKELAHRHGRSRRLRWPPLALSGAKIFPRAVGVDEQLNFSKKNFGAK